MIKKTVLMIFLLFFFSSLSAAASSQLGILANGDVVAGSMDFFSINAFGTVHVGSTVKYHDEDYLLASVHTAIENDQLAPGLRYRLGFQLSGGEADHRKHPIEGTVAAFGFLMGADYELIDSVNPVNMPVEMGVSIAIAPDSLCFEDTVFYQEYKCALKLHVLPNAYMMAEYSYLNIQFDASGFGKWRREDHILVGGITLRF